MISKPVSLVRISLGVKIVVCCWSYNNRETILELLLLILQIDRRYLSTLKSWSPTYYIKNVLEDIRKNLMTAKENMKLAQPPEGATF